MTQNNPTDKASIRRFDLECYVNGDASPELAARIEADPDLLKQAEAIRARNAQFLQFQTSTRFVESVVTEPSSSKGTSLLDFLRSPNLLKANIGFALVLLVSSLAFLQYNSQIKGPQGSHSTALIPHTDSGSRIKGESIRLQVFRQGQEAALQDGDTAREGDVLQLQFQVAEPQHIAIISIDGRGVLTTHIPEARDGDTAPLFPAGVHRLPWAYALDDAPDFERFVLISSGVEFSAAHAIAAYQNKTASELDFQELTLIKAAKEAGEAKGAEQ